jgi:glycosyltransferase involved in cell wall biosynthesis
MKVLQILPELNAGGVERVVMVLSDYLVANRHQSVVVSNGGRMVAALEKSGARHLALPVHKKSLGSLFQVRPLRRLLEQERPDILHLHSRVPGWIAWLAWRKINPQTRPRLVSTVHGFYSVNAYSAIMMRGERVIAVSECIRDYVEKDFPKTAKVAIRLVRHSIDPVHSARGFQPDFTWLAQWRKDFPQFTGKQLLVLPGRITRLKGHEDFLKLLAALRQTHPQIHGVIVGDTHPKKRAYLDELKQLVHQLNLTNDVTFVGHRSDLREVLAVSAVTYSLSTSPESFGLTTLEALALGRPVIGYDHGGVGELLRDLFPAGRVPLRDEAALRATTQSLLASSPEPKPVQEPFTLDAMCRGTLDVYRELLQAPRH